MKCTTVHTVEYIYSRIKCYTTVCVILNTVLLLGEIPEYSSCLTIKRIRSFYLNNKVAGCLSVFQNYPFKCLIIHHVSRVMKRLSCHSHSDVNAKTGQCTELYNDCCFSGEDNHAHNHNRLLDSSA